MTEVLCIAISLALSAALTFFCALFAIRQAIRSGWLDRPDNRKRHTVPTPPVGGILLGLVLITSMLLLFIQPGIVREFLATGRGALTTAQLFAIAGASLLMLTIGLLDDRRGLPSWIKFLCQLLAGLILYAGGFRIDPIELPIIGIVSLGNLSLLVTVLWVVVLTNAINLIDGLDGLACGVSLPAAMVLVVVSLRHGSPVGAILAAMLVGFLATFLLYNRHPARAFLGNSGAYLIGLLFAVISLVLPLKSSTATALFLPLIVLGVPIIETLSSITRRIAAGQPIWQADRMHIFHLLTRAGLSPQTTVRIFWLVSAIFSGFALLAYTLDRTTLIAALSLFLLVIWLSFFMFTRQRLGRRRGSRMRNSKTQTP